MLTSDFCIFYSPGQVAQLLGAFSDTPNVGGFIPSQGTYLVGVCVGGNQSMFLSQVDVSLSLTLSHFLFPLSKINKCILEWVLKSILCMTI